MVVLCALCCCINYADRVNMSITIITIAKEYSFSLQQQSFILSFFFLGYLPMQMGGAMLCRRFGAKLVLTIGAALWSLFTLLTPAACNAGYFPLLACRVLMGVSEGVAYPSVYHFLSTWIPPAERSRSIAFTLTGTHVGTTLALITSPIIIRYLSWQAVFYIFGLTGFIWIAFWHHFAYDRDDTAYQFSPIPANEQSVVSKSDSTDGKEKELTSNSKEIRIIYAILTNKRTLGLCVSHSIFALIHFVILSWLPTYFTKVYQVQSISLSFTFLPYFSMALSAPLGGYLADALTNRGLTTAGARKAVTTLANTGAATMLLFFANAKTVPAALGFISLSMAFMSLNSGGYACSFMDMAAPSAVGLFQGVSNTLSSFAGFVAIPFCTLILTLLGGSWRGTFASLTLCYAFMTVVYCCFISGVTVVDENGFICAEENMIVDGLKSTQDSKSNLKV